MSELTVEADKTADTTDFPAVQDVPAPTPAPVALVEEDLLVEDVSIDGMCGVY